MKLLIIAGPYEADRIRHAAVAIGFETVAVEPGESLSAWITASRPDLIILAPQVVSNDPLEALARVRAVPRGRRVPIFLVGDSHEEPVLQSLADGFFVRPLVADDLLARAREVAARVLARTAEDESSGPHTADGSGPVPSENAANESSTPASGPASGRTSQPLSGTGAVSQETSAPHLRPLVSAPPPSGEPMGRRRGRRSRTNPAMLDEIAHSIDAAFDADIEEAVRVVEAIRREKSAPRATEGDAGALGARGADAGRSDGGDSRGADGDSDTATAIGELEDENSQKTLEVPEAAAIAAIESHTLGSTASSRADLLADEADIDLPALLARIHLSAISGRLTVAREGVEKYVVFDRGRPMRAASNSVNDRLGAMLARQGRFSGTDIAAVAEDAAARGERLGTVMVDGGLMSEAELPHLVRWHYEQILYSLFSWARGGWVLGSDHNDGSEPIQLTQHPAALILRGIRGAYSRGRTRAAVAGGTAAFRVRDGAAVDELLSEMGASDAERRAVFLLDGMRTVDEAAAEARADADGFFAVVHVLRLLKCLVEQRDAEVDRARVTEAHALCEYGDYFQILGVPPTASREEVHHAYIRRAAELAPETLHPAVARDLDDQIRDIRTVLDEAERLLSDESLRESYRAALSADAIGEIPTASSANAPDLR